MARSNKVLIILVLGFFLAVWKSNGAWAEGSVDVMKPYDFDGDGKAEKVSLVFSEPDDYGNCEAILKVVSLGKTYKSRLKEGFNAETTFLKKLVLSDKVKPFILIDAKMRSSKNRWVYSFNGKKLKPELAVYSNLFTIIEKDIERDGTNEIVVSLRDDRPGRDPSKDSYERYYKWNGAKFYDATEDRFKKIKVEAPKPQVSDDDWY